MVAGEPLTIAFWGSSLVSAYWNGAATYYRGIIRALNARGHQVTFFEPDALSRQQHRDLPDPEWARVVVYDPGGDLSPHLAESDRADVVVKASGVGVLDDWLVRALLRRRRSWQRVLFWDVDAPATLAALDDGREPVLREALEDFDAVLTYGGGPPVIAAYRARGARFVRPIYNAVDPATHHPAAPEPRFEADLALLANRLPDREDRLRAFFIDVARRLPSLRFVLGGNGWGPDDVPENVTLLGHVPPDSHNALNCSARLVLNVSRDDMARMGYSPATRVFEAAGAGACLISDAWEGMETFLEPGREVLLARNGDEVARWLTTIGPERAREIGERACERVLAEHTYAHRALDVERAFADMTQEVPQRCAS
jgi:spore maturation protein CgeB